MTVKSDGLSWSFFFIKPKTNKKYWSQNKHITDLKLTRNCTKQLTINFLELYEFKPSMSMENEIKIISIRYGWSLFRKIKFYRNREHHGQCTSPTFDVLDLTKMVVYYNAYVDTFFPFSFCTRAILHVRIKPCKKIQVWGYPY